MMAVSATSPKAFVFVIANLYSIPLRHSSQIRTACRDTPFILKEKDAILHTIVTQIDKIREHQGDSSMCVAFSVGINAIVVVKGHQLLQSEGLVVDGAYPSHLMDVSDLGKDGLKKFLKDCLDGKKRKVATESEMAVFFISRDATRYVSLLDPIWCVIDYQWQ